MKKYIIGLFLVSILLPNSLFAYTTINGNEQIRLDTAIDDNLYVAGGKIDSIGAISGDGIFAGGELNITSNIGDNAMIAGGNIEINGTIQRDLMIVGGDIQIKNYVFGDIRAFGGKISLEKSASGDVTMAGGSIKINKDVIIGRDLALGGGDMNINGVIEGKADIYVGTLDLNAIIKKDASIRIDDAKSLHIGPDAKILGKLIYRSNERIPELEKIAIGGATYAGTVEFSQNKEEKKEMLYGFLTGYIIYKLLFLLILGSILLGVFKTSIQKIAMRIMEAPGKSFLNGLLYFILTPIIAILLFITVIGIPLGFLTIALYIFGFVFSEVITLVIFTQLINSHWSNHITKSWQKWGIFTLIALALTMVNGIDLIATIFVYGAICTSILKK